MARQPAPQGSVTVYLLGGHTLTLDGSPEDVARLMAALGDPSVSTITVPNEGGATVLAKSAIVAWRSQAG